jgi:sigma-E factor negative regulatory protein RseC
MSVVIENNMLTEQGVVVAIEPDALWVETIQQSTCGTCAARKGCGQKLLSSMGASATQLRVLIDHTYQRNYAVGDSVTIAIPENVVVLGSLFIYLLPLIFTIVFSGFAHTFFQVEAVSMLAGMVGFIGGAMVIRYHAYLSKNDPDLQPILISDASMVRISTTTA